LAFEEWSIQLCLRFDLSYFFMLVQAALSEGFLFDPFSFEKRRPLASDYRGSHGIGGGCNTR
jgi:hypothetical protein